MLRHMACFLIAAGALHRSCTHAVELDPNRQQVDHLTQNTLPAFVRNVFACDFEETHSHAPGATQWPGVHGPIGASQPHVEPGPPPPSSKSKCTSQVSFLQKGGQS